MSEHQLNAENESVAIECCPECVGTLVYPTEWSETEHDCWKIHLRCPECEWSGGGIYRHVDVERFDLVLCAGTDTLIDTCERLSQSNMREYVERFAYALLHDAIQPEDF